MLQTIGDTGTVATVGKMNLKTLKQIAVGFDVLCCFKAGILNHKLES